MESIFYHSRFPLGYTSCIRYYILPVSKHIPSIQPDSPTAVMQNYIKCPLWKQQQTVHTETTYTQIMCTDIIELYGLHTNSNWISWNLCNKNGLHEEGWIVWTCILRQLQCERNGLLKCESVHYVTTFVFQTQTKYRRAYSILVFFAENKRQKGKTVTFIDRIIYINVSFTFKFFNFGFCTLAEHAVHLNLMNWLIVKSMLWAIFNSVQCNLL